MTSPAVCIEANADASMTYRWLARATFFAATLAWPWARVPSAAAWASTEAAPAACTLWLIWAALTAWSCPAARRRRPEVMAVLLLGQAGVLGLALGLTFMRLAGHNASMLLFVLAASYAAIAWLMALRGGADSPHLHATAFALWGGTLVWLTYRWFVLRPSMVAALVAAVVVAAMRLAMGHRRRSPMAPTVDGRLGPTGGGGGAGAALRLLCGCTMLHAAAPAPLPQTHGACGGPTPHVRHGASMMGRHFIACCAMALGCCAAGYAMRLWDDAVAGRAAAVAPAADATRRRTP